MLHNHWADYLTVYDLAGLGYSLLDAVANLHNSSEEENVSSLVCGGMFVDLSRTSRAHEVLVAATLNHKGDVTLVLERHLMSPVSLATRWVSRWGAALGCCWNPVQYYLDRWSHAWVLITVWATDPEVRDYRAKRLSLPSSVPLGLEHRIGHSGSKTICTKGTVARGTLQVSEKNVTPFHSKKSFALQKINILKIWNGDSRRRTERRMKNQCRLNELTK
ncbi:hypothetical protein J6590_012998 [Homalodisca vitripennis]|nr:hypothetical protein J6590_012998 [Homalodisca vitripennis]